MKPQSFLAAVLVASVPFFVASAQHQHEMQSGEKAKPHKMSDMMMLMLWVKTMADA